MMRCVPLRVLVAFVHPRHMACVCGSTQQVDPGADADASGSESDGDSSDDGKGGDGCPNAGVASKSSPRDAAGAGAGAGASAGAGAGAGAGARAGGGTAGGDNGSRTEYQRAVVQGAVRAAATAPPPSEADDVLSGLDVSTAGAARIAARTRGFSAVSDAVRFVWLCGGVWMCA